DRLDPLRPPAGGRRVGDAPGLGRLAAPLPRAAVDVLLPSGHELLLQGPGGRRAPRQGGRGQRRVRDRLPAPGRHLAPQPRGRRPAVRPPGAARHRPHRPRQRHRAARPRPARPQRRRRPLARARVAAGGPGREGGEMVSWTVHLDMRAPSFGTPAPELYRAALDLAAWADEHGVQSIAVSEHHGEEDGYLPSPLVMAAAVAARTERAFVAVNALALTWRDPLLAAEEVLVLDHLSGGRAVVTVVPGYVPSEFELFGVDRRRRGAIFEEKLAVFAEALTGEPVTWDGRTVRVTPPPVSRPRPMLVVGGASRAAARRAARYGDAFAPTTDDGTLAAAYREECAALGRDPGPVFVHQGPMAPFVHRDPDEAWRVIGPHALHELNQYGKWAAMHEGHPYVDVTDVEAARASGFYRVETPEGAIEHVRSLPPGQTVLFKPLMAGLDPAFGRAGLELFVDEVLPKL